YGFFGKQAPIVAVPYLAEIRIGPSASPSHAIGQDSHAQAAPEENARQFQGNAGFSRASRAQGAHYDHGNGGNEGAVPRDAHRKAMHPRNGPVKRRKRPQKGMRAPQPTGNRAVRKRSNN